MYQHFDCKHQLLITRCISSHLHEILWSKMPSGGRFSSRPLSHLQWQSSFASNISLTSNSKSLSIVTGAGGAVYGGEKGPVLPVPAVTHGRPGGLSRIAGGARW